MKGRQEAAQVFADKWERIYPKAVLCLRKDIDDLLTFFRFKEEPVRVWKEYCMLYLPMKTKRRELIPLSY